MSKEQEETKKPLSLVQKLRQVMLAAGSVEKKGFNSHQNYKYVRESDVADAVREAFVDGGIIWVPSIEESSVQAVETVNRGEKKTAFMALVKVKFQLVNADDTADRIELWGCGVGLDIGDKCLPKAFTMAQKGTLQKLLVMGSDDDAENPKHDPHVETPTAGAPSTPPPQQQQSSNYRGDSPRTAEEWAAYWTQFPFEYDIPYKVTRDDATLKDAMRAAKAQFRGGKNKDKSDNGDTAANKHWYTKSAVPLAEPYRVGATAPSAPQQVAFEDDDIPF